MARRPSDRTTKWIDKRILYKLVARRLGWRLAEAAIIGDIGDVMFDIIASSLHANVEVRVQGFGSFRRGVVIKDKRGFREFKPVLVPSENLPEPQWVAPDPRKKRKRKKLIMVKGFENDTHVITEMEREVLVPLFIEGFLNHRGKDNPVTSTEIIKGMKIKGYQVGSSRVRTIVNYIRMNGLVPLLMASQKGYWVTDSEKEVSDYLQSLKDRIESIQKVRMAVLLQARKKFPGKDFR